MGVRVHGANGHKPAWRCGSQRACKAPFPTIDHDLQLVRCFHHRLLDFCRTPLVDIVLVLRCWPPDAFNQRTRSNPTPRSETSRSSAPCALMETRCYSMGLFLQPIAPCPHPTLNFWRCGWRGRDGERNVCKTSPCVGSKRFRVCRQNAHMTQAF